MLIIWQLLDETIKHQLQEAFSCVFTNSYDRRWPMIGLPMDNIVSTGAMGEHHGVKSSEQGKEF